MKRISILCQIHLWLFILEINNTRFDEFGRTEVAKDNSYPTFAKQFKLDYYFEEVWDEDKKGSKRLKDHDFIGTATVICW